MGRINKALNRSNYKTVKPTFSNSNFQNKRQQQYLEREQAREDKRELKLIEFSEDQLARKDLKFVYELPKTVKALKETLADATEEDKLVIIQRIRDYYNPVLEPQHTNKFKQFTACLISYFLSKDSESDSIKKHLQEMCSQYGTLFSAFLKSKLQKVLSVLKDLKENIEALQAEQLDELEKLLEQVIECQVFVIKVLECPTNSKLLEVLEQATGHIYQIQKLFLEKQTKMLIQVVENDIKICAKLHKKFNPALTMILLCLLTHAKSDESIKKKLKKLTDQHFEKNLSTLPWAQVLTSDLYPALQHLAASKHHHLEKQDSILVKRQHDLGLSHPVPLSSSPLTHLRLQAKKPKELTSFNPQIDEDFISAALDDEGKRYKKREETDKEVKRKTKKAEKDAMRELKKDTVQLQVQRDRELEQRKSVFLKSVIRGGNVKDDV